MKFTFNYIHILFFIFLASCTQTKAPEQRPIEDPNVIINNLELKREIEKFIEYLPKSPLYDSSNVIVVLISYKNKEYNITLINDYPPSCQNIIGYNYVNNFKVFFHFEQYKKNPFIEIKSNYNCNIPDEPYLAYPETWEQRFFSFKNDTLKQIYWDFD